VFLTSGRTIAPYVYEQYFPNAEWLKHIKPENCRFTVQLGSVVTPLMTFELTKDSLMHHPTFEVAALSLDPEDEERFMSANASNPTPFLLPASLSSAIPEERSTVMLAGHDIFAAGDKHHCAVVEWRECTILACSHTRGLVKTPIAMPASFSGGGVFGCEPGDEMSLYGILEGELPPDKDTPELVENFHCGTFISASAIRSWLSNPESASSAFE
jgi:hypothetical protein